MKTQEFIIIKQNVIYNILERLFVQIITRIFKIDVKLHPYHSILIEYTMVFPNLCVFNKHKSREQCGREECVVLHMEISKENYYYHS